MKRNENKYKWGGTESVESLCKNNQPLRKTRTSILYSRNQKTISKKKSTADKACFINCVAEDNKKMMQAIDAAHYLCHIVALRLCLKGTIIFWRSEHLTQKTLCVFFPTICKW